MLVRLAVAALATWRLSSLLLYEDGPLDAFLWLRSIVAGGPVPFRILFGCVYCLSVWVGLACAVLMVTDGWVVLLPFALSAAAILVDKHVQSDSRSH